MKQVLLLLLIYTFSVFALEVKVSVEPDSPVKDEPFRVIFEVSSEKGGTPIISFDPFGAEVIEKVNLGSTTRTTYINGKLSTDRKVTIAYDMMPKQLGSIYIRSIKVSMNGETKEVPTVRKTVLSEPRRARDIFALAEVDKTEAFVNEAILVRYYLYNRVNVSTTDIIKFPDLNKFMKRFHQEKLRPERIRYNGQLYMRRIIYTAQVFANKAGDYKIDPIKMSVNYSRSRDPFDSLGFGGGFGRQRKLTVVSKPIDVKIKQLPIENVPTNFTGLVGKHNFSLEFNKSKFVVNEPIEIKLKVSGDGALELFEAPRILTSPEVEQFEVTSDLQINPNFSANKNFDYTYLGRQNLETPKREIKLSYFDPEKLQFTEVSLPIPALKIAGGSFQNKTVAKDEDKGRKQVISAVDNDGLNDKPSFDYYTPIYNTVNTYKYNSKYIAIILSVIALIILFLRFKEEISSLLKKEIDESDFFNRVVSEGMSYGDLYLLSEMLGTDHDINSRIDNSKLSNDQKKYLMNLLIKLEKTYKNKKTKTIKVDKRKIREIKDRIMGSDEL